jgi:hypothetical protein
VDSRSQETNGVPANTERPHRRFTKHCVSSCMCLHSFLAVQRSASTVPSLCILDWTLPRSLCHLFTLFPTPITRLLATSLLVAQQRGLSLSYLSTARRAFTCHSRSHNETLQPCASAGGAQRAVIFRCTNASWSSRA